MKTFDLKNFTKGWIVGDFDTSVIRTKDFEVSLRFYKKGDTETAHVHKIAQEITVILGGVFIMNGKEFRTNDIILLEKGEAADFVCIEEGWNAVIKIPSVIGDKYVME